MLSGNKQVQGRKGGKSGPDFSQDESLLRVGSGEAFGQKTVARYNVDNCGGRGACHIEAFPVTLLRKGV